MSQHSFFSEQQLQRLSSTNEILRKLNDAARTQLQHAANSYLTKQEYRQAAESFEVLAIRMNSVLRFREIAGQRRQPDVAIVTFGTICGSCDDPLDEPRDDIPEVLKLDVAQLRDIDCLLELAYRTEERICARCTLPGSLPKVFFSGLSRLTRALQSQRRHLLARAPAQRTTIEVEQDRSGICMVCKRPIPDMTDANDR